MLRRRIPSASSSLILNSTSFYRELPEFVGSLKPRLSTRSSSGRLRLPLTREGFRFVTYDAIKIAAGIEGRFASPDMKRFKQGQKRPFDEPDGSPAQVLDLEAKSMLAKLRDELGVEKDPDRAGKESRPEFHSIFDVEITELSSTGDGLAYSPNKDLDFIYVVPFSVPGDKAQVKLFPQKDDLHPWMKVDLVKIVTPSPSRDGVVPKCKYFGKCSGCQFQMLPYEAQLAHKKTIVEKAFRYFSNLDPSLVPAVDDIIGSPIQYGYRTKITPHYEQMHKSRPWKSGDPIPPVGFQEKNMRNVVDIEKCEIATDILNLGLMIERENLASRFWKTNRGATILLRESTHRELLPPPSDSGDGKGKAVRPADVEDNPSTIEDLSSLPLEYAGAPVSENFHLLSPKVPQIEYNYPTFRDLKTYTTKNEDLTTEHVGPYQFTSPANSFFQNNNSVLPVFLSYIREHVFRPKEESSSSSQKVEPEIKYLLDAYCGSGLFSIALANKFSAALGIDVDPAGIECARANANINATPRTRSHVQSQSNSTSKDSETAGSTGNLGFIAADARAIFEDVPFPAAETLCIIDPPRKGASRDFLEQLCRYGAKRVVYVSCNVHTQARDVGMLVAGFAGDGTGRGSDSRRSQKSGKSYRYEIEKLGGFDFFPQTGHVEGVCILNRVEE